MEIVLIVFLAVAMGITGIGFFYEPEKPKQKLPDWVVVADDGDDE